MCSGGVGHKQAATQLNCVAPRRHGIRYEVEHQPGATSADDVLLIITNLDGAKNFKLMKTPLSALGGTRGMAQQPSIDTRGMAQQPIDSNTESSKSCKHPKTLSLDEKTESFDL